MLKELKNNKFLTYVWGGVKHKFNNSFDLIQKDNQQTILTQNAIFNKGNKAFTLAEVLITLVIIGVIAAITVPTLSATWQKQALKSAFTKAVSDLNAISRSFYSDYGYSISEYIADEGYNTSYKILDKYIKLNHDDAVLQGWNKDNDPDYEYFYKSLSGKNSHKICDDYGLFPDISGRLIGLNNPPKQGENGPVICIDTNGMKGPNKFGYDYFLFIFTLDGRVIPMGMKDDRNTSDTSNGYNFSVSGTNYCSKSAGSSSSGYSCAYYALANQHPTQKDKNYWDDFL